MGIIIDKIQSRSQVVEKMISSACEQITGNAMLENETLAEYIQRVFHIPAREMSDVLRKTPEEIENECLINKTFRHQLIKNLKRSYKHIHLIQEKKIADIRWNKSTKKWHTVSEPIEKEWFFASSSGLEYCWLPFDYLP